MKNILVSMVLAAAAAISDAKLIVMPPTTTTGNDIAIVWIHGMECSNRAY